MTASGLEQIIRAADGATAFMLLMQALQAWQPLMTQLLMMLAWSHRGLREMELLQLLPTLNHATLRAFKDMILDEMLMPVFGVKAPAAPCLFYRSFSLALIQSPYFWASVVLVEIFAVFGAPVTP